MNREEFRMQLKKVITNIESALVLDGLPSISSPVPGLPPVRARDLSDPEDQRGLLQDLHEDLDEILERLGKQEGGHDDD